MADAPSAYPLAWPSGYARNTGRRTSPFRSDRGTVPIRLEDARRRLADQMGRLGARYPVVSTNLELRADGQPRARQADPLDPGVAVYFQLEGKPVAMPCDAFDSVAGNMAAIAAHIEATRAIGRYQVGTVAQMYEGFMALAAPGAPRTWREVLGFPPGATVTRDQVQAKRRELARRHHSDADGSDAAMVEINAAADAALREML